MKFFLEIQNGYFWIIQYPASYFANACLDAAAFEVYELQIRRPFNQRSNGIRDPFHLFMMQNEPVYVREVVQREDGGLHLRLTDIVGKHPEIVNSIFVFYFVMVKFGDFMVVLDLHACRKSVVRHLVLLRDT